MSRKWRNILIGVLVAALVIGGIWLLSRSENNFRSKYEGADLSTDITGIGRSNTYTAYVAQYKDLPAVTDTVEVDLASFEGEGGEACADGVLTADESELTWKVNMPKAGLYNIQMEYLTVESRGIDIEREIAINGEVPFSGASTLSFSRLWTDAGEVRKDNQGNDVRPTQIERFERQTAYCMDDMGYQTEPYAFYFNEGENELTIRAINEPVILCAVRMTPLEKFPSYEEYIAGQPEVTMSEEALNYSQTIQGESSLLRSAPSLYPRYDRSSALTEPYSVSNTILNYIGGDAWTNPGDWIEWSFSVPEDGYYNLSIKARQMYQRGALSARTVYIDGEVPFKDLEAVTFGYRNNWEMRTLSDQEGNPCRFYLTKGEHTIRMEVTLGEMGPILKEVEDSIYRLNQIYRKVLVLTGVNPDRYRDYKLQQVYPEVIEAMDLESKRLYKIVDDTVATTGEKSDRIAAAQTLGAGDYLLLVIGIGVLCSVFPLIAGLVYAKYIGKKIRSADETVDNGEVVKTYEELKAEFGRLPGGWNAVAPLVVPILLMGLSSVSSMAGWTGWIADGLAFLGTPVMALAAGTVLAVIQLFTSGRQGEFYDMTNDTLKTVGPILFVTAAGGVLGKVISSSDMVNFITQHANTLQAIGIFFPFLLAAVLKSAQGSSTVAITTTAGIVAPLLPVLGFTAPVDVALVVMAIGAGAMTVSHANDSYFWVVTNFGEMKTEEGYRSHTLMTLVIGIAAMIEIFILSLIF